MTKRESLSGQTTVDFKSTPLEPLAFKARVVQFGSDTVTWQASGFAAGQQGQFSLMPCAS